MKIDQIEIDKDGNVKEKPFQEKKVIFNVRFSARFKSGS